MNWRVSDEQLAELLGRPYKTDAMDGTRPYKVCTFENETAFYLLHDLRDCREWFASSQAALRMAMDDRTALRAERDALREALVTAAPFVPDGTECARVVDDALAESR